MEDDRITDFLFETSMGHLVELQDGAAVARRAYQTGITTSKIASHMDTSVWGRRGFLKARRLASLRWWNLLYLLTCLTIYPPRPRRPPHPLSINTFLLSPASMSADTPTIVLSVLEHLASIEPEHPAETRPQLQTAMSSLSEAFNVSLDDPKQVAQYSLRPHTLASIVSASGAKSAAQQLAELQSSEAFTQFVKVVSAKGYFKGVEEGSAEYSDRMSKLVAKFKARTEAASGGPAVEEAGTSTSRAIPPPTAENKAAEGGGGAPSTGAKAAKEKKAEAVKGQGNKLLLAKDYEGAERCYTEALELSPEGPNSHVYLCNRAAALCYLSRNDDAVVDCQESIDLNPSYAKAYTRLGYAYFQVNLFSWFAWVLAWSASSTVFIVYFFYRWNIFVLPFVRVCSGVWWCFEGCR